MLQSAHCNTIPSRQSHSGKVVRRIVFKLLKVLQQRKRKGVKRNAVKLNSHLYQTKLTTYKMHGIDKTLVEAELGQWMGQQEEPGPGQSGCALGRQIRRAYVPVPVSERVPSRPTTVDNYYDEMMDCHIHRDYL